MHKFVSSSGATCVKPENGLREGFTRALLARGRTPHAAPRRAPYQRLPWHRFSGSPIPMPLLHGTLVLLSATPLRLACLHLPVSLDREEAWKISAFLVAIDPLQKA